MTNTLPVKVGLLFSETGATGKAEAALRFGALMAIEEINEAGGIDGRELMAVCYDPFSEPFRYGQLAERLIVDDGVKVIFGCYMSSTRKVVIPVVERRNALLFYATLYEGFEFSNNVIYSGAAPNQNSVQLADYMTSVYGPRVYMIGSDYIYPHESNRIMSELVLQHSGGACVEERYVRLDATGEDFKMIMDEIWQQRPDFIFSTVVGDATRHLYRAYAEGGFSPHEMPIASLTTSEVEIAQMGACVAEGHISSSPYFQSINTAVNRDCLRRFHQRFGGVAVPNAGWEAAYCQMHLFANAMRQCGSDDIDVLMPSLRGSQFCAPQGVVKIDPHNHHTCVYPRIGRANAQGQYTIVRESLGPVTPDPYLISHCPGNWMRESTAPDT